MSASQRPGKNSPDTTRDDAPPDIDAYAIAIPEGFVAAYPAADTVAEALRLAEQAPAHDADATADRDCPRCGSVRITRKTGYDSQQEHTTQWVCTHCRTHFDDPEHPEVGSIEFTDGQVQLSAFTEARADYERDEWLHRKYVTEGRSIAEIADLCDCADKVIEQRLRNLSVEPDAGAPVQYKRLAREGWVREQVIANDKSQRQLADEVGCARKTLRRWLVIHGIIPDDQPTEGDADE